MNQDRKWLPALSKTVLGCAVFALGFNLFLSPNDLNAGGISGLAMAFVQLTGFGTVGLLTVLVNLPLFLLGGLRIGRRFLLGSIFGMLTVSFLIDLLAYLPDVVCNPMAAALYGGALCGLGIGLVFSTGLSTGGSDIIVRLIKRRWRSVPIGVISSGFDMAVAALTGVVFQSIERALYSGVAIFVAGQIIDAVVYRFDYSRVALIVTEKHRDMAGMIAQKLNRGATFLYAEGAYSRRHTMVVLTAVKRNQLADLKELVTDLDPNAFIIVQEAHQVLGDGFVRYSSDAI